jgi:hypothetical protein
MHPALKPRLRNPAATALRDRNCIQVDIDPSHSLLLTGDIAQIREFLSLLTGEHTVAELTARFEFAKSTLFQLSQRGLLETELFDSDITAGLTAAQLNQLLITQRSQQAARADLNFAKERIQNLSDSYIWIANSGAASALTALLLAQQHVGRIKLADLAGFTHVMLPYWITSAEPADVQLVNAMQAASTNLKLTQPAGMPDPDLVIIADRPWRDPSETSSLLNRSIPHLIIDPLISEVAIGPLVIPGKSSCLNCQEQQLVNVDQSWPIMRKLIGQHATVQPDQLLLLTAISFAVAQLTTAISESNLERCALVNQRWRFKLPGPSIEIVNCQPNMFCSCQWGAIAA